MKYILPAILIIALANGCNVMHPRINGSGIEHSEIRYLESFDDIKLSGFGTVNVIVGDVQTVQVSTDDNLITLVETSVDNRKLKIKPRPNIHPKTGLRIDITVPQLTAAKISGAGDINVHNMNGKVLELAVSGAGTLSANGNVQHISTSISGAGSAELEELYADSADVSISGAGNAHVYATQSLNARVSGAGNVICDGNPIDVQQRVSGVGGVTTRR